MLHWFKGQLTVLSVLLAFICAFMLYLLIDSKVTIDHARQEQEYQHRRISLLIDMFWVTGAHLPRTEMAELVIKRFKKDHIVKENKDKVQVDDILIKFKGESFDGIEFLE